MTWPEAHDTADHEVDGAIASMRKCMVIQPFDGGEFDKRYSDVFAPAIREAGMEPYRVDEDPSAGILIEAIEENIRDADACLADISVENPNVWYEVGFAFATGKEVVLVSKAGSSFPFDVRHRQIVQYRTESPRDFEELTDSSPAKVTPVTSGAGFRRGG